MHIRALIQQMSRKMWPAHTARPMKRKPTTELHPVFVVRHVSEPRNAAAAHAEPIPRVFSQLFQQFFQVIEQNVVMDARRGRLLLDGAMSPALDEKNDP
jgi:hypothetical protein